MVDPKEVDRTTERTQNSTGIYIEEIDVKTEKLLVETLIIYQPGSCFIESAESWIY